MTRILLSTFVLFFALTASATKPTKVNYLTDKYMKIISLEGLEITNADTAEQVFIYNIKPVETVTKELSKFLAAETDSKVISRVYELDEESSFKNIYVYVGYTVKSHYTKSKFILNIVMVNQSNSTFVMDFPITEAGLKELKLEAGTGQEPETAIATLKQGTFFPY